MIRSAVILYNAVEPGANAADADVLVQVAVVREALEQLGWQVRELAATLDLAAVERELTAAPPDVVFNLVESLNGRDRLAPLVVELLEVLRISCTGCGSAALRLSNDKIATKNLLAAAGLPTPPWFATGGWQPLSSPPGVERCCIFKPISEHASAGMDDTAVMTLRDEDVSREIELRGKRTGMPFFAEEFIGGREFNLSLLERQGEVMVLPPAEIQFQNFPAEKPKIVGYAAKWHEHSFEFQNTPRTFEFSAHDAGLLGQLEFLARQCWEICGLRSYARVDFRVDEQGQPWILEINANPCLSPDGGFAAALAQGKITFAEAVQALMNSAGNHGPVASGRLQPAKRPATKCALRHEVRPEDLAEVRRIVASTNMFRPGEIDVAAELVEARLTRGKESGYEFIFVERDGRTVGYVCFGRNTLTVSSFDLYWIAVEQEQRGHGLGAVLLEEVEQRVAAEGGTRIYIETSHRPDYEPTRRFYERHGYLLQALLPDFYAPGDGRAIFVKRELSGHQRQINP